jgi:hypothetical protein
MICKPAEIVLVMVEGKHYKKYVVNKITGACHWGRIGKNITKGSAPYPHRKISEKIDKGYRVVYESDSEPCPACGKHTVGKTYNHITPQYDLHLCITCGYNATPDDPTGMATLQRYIEDQLGGIL